MAGRSPSVSPFLLFHRFIGSHASHSPRLPLNFNPLAKIHHPCSVSHFARCSVFTHISFFSHGNGLLHAGSNSIRSDRLTPFSSSSDGNNGGGPPSKGLSGGGSDENGDAEGGGNKWSLLSWYLDLLARYPVLTKAITSALLTFFGDLICQLMIDQVASLDFKRTIIFTLLGFALVGPTLHFWYLYLSKAVTITGGAGALLRLVLDQFLFSPIFIGVFLSTLLTLEGRPSEVFPKLKQDWFSSVIANWQLWIPFQFLNFRFVPQQFQVLAANVIALIWNVILSFKAHKNVTQN